MLDDLKYIHEKDKMDTLGIASKQWQQILYKPTLQGSANFGNVRNIVFGGMGGSADAALFAHTWPALKVPFELVRDYTVPEYVDQDTLFIASSYSGNTEESIAALADAEKRGAQIAVLAADGKLKQIAEEKDYARIIFPKAAQPRYAVFYSYKALLTVLEAASVLPAKDVDAELERVAHFLENSVKAWAPEVPTAKNPAKQMAQELMGKSVVIYAGPKMFPAAYKWKIDVNENAKQVAWCNQLPEFNHNEFIGWSQQPVDKPYVVVDLRSNLEHPRIQKRFEVSERLLSGMRPAPHVVEVQGDTLLEQLLWAVNFGDFVSLYLALLNGQDPAPVDLVEKFKKSLD